MKWERPSDRTALDSARGLCPGVLCWVVGKGHARGLGYSWSLDTRVYSAVPDRLQHGRTEGARQDQQAKGLKGQRVSEGGHGTRRLLTSQGGRSPGPRGPGAVTIRAPWAQKPEEGGNGGWMATGQQHWMGTGPGGPGTGSEGSGL